jgi:serine/threonine-protein kinase
VIGRRSWVDEVKLNRSWLLAGELGSGGFGRVYEASGDDGSLAVVKLVPKAPGASRELLFENLPGLANIVPILESGEYDGYYALVMPRAEKSLRQHLQDAGGKLGVDEAVSILVDVAEALASLEAGVVHRDLKPDNVLLYKGRWCLADFGIARYAEATTAPDTHKFSKTAEYAAPEQWRGDRATSATDVYSFGVMAFELLQGRLPFPGPDFREEHLTQPPPSVSGCPPLLASLVTECLFKPPAARPTSANLLERLRRIGQPPSPAGGRLQVVQHAVAQRQSEEAAKMSAQQSREERRRELFDAGMQSLRRILDSLRDHAVAAAPATNVSSAGSKLTLRLGEGALVVEPVQTAPAECLAAFDYEPAFDVIAFTAIATRKPRDRYDYEGRAHSLWFCDAQDEGVYRWFELAFMVHPMVAQRYTLDPFALAPTDEHAAGALVPVMDVRQLAWQPVPIDQGEEEMFIERWLGWFAAAADGSLSHPSTLPEQSGGRYRAPRRREQRY